MIVGAKYKICRRLGSGVYDKCQTQSYMVSEARHSKKKGSAPKALSDYGKQLLEKQRIRFGYGVNERQIRRYVAEATRKSGVNPVARLLEQLEMRLDNAVYRAGIAPTRRLARQMVSHGHIVVNGRRVNVPSYTLKVGDVFGARPESKGKPLFENRREEYEKAQTAVWLAFDPSNLSVKVTAAPTPENTESLANLSAVLEFYSR